MAIRKGRICADQTLTSNMTMWNRFLAEAGQATLTADRHHAGSAAAVGAVPAFTVDAQDDLYADDRRHPLAGVPGS